MTGATTGTAADVASAPAVTLDCFGTLVTAERPDAPWDAVATELRARDVPVPADWEAAYRTGHVDCGRMEELALSRHVVAALDACGVECDPATARDAVFAAFDRPVDTRPGASTVLARLDAADVPVGVVSNCSVHGLVASALDRAGLDRHLDAVVTSVDCGWRKPHPHPFETAANRLGLALEDLVHVGDDAAADGGAERAGGTTVLVDEAPLSEIATILAGGGPCR